MTAGGVGLLFGVNTVTGLWNLYEGRHDANGRRLRTAHALLLLASDAGFVATGVMGSRATQGDVPAARRHRGVAVGSMSVAVVGASLMWLFRD